MRHGRRLLLPLAAIAAAALFGGVVTGIATAASTDGLTATYRTTSAWAGGQAGVYRVANHGDTTVDGWTLTFTLPGGAVIGRLWNGILDPVGEAYTVVAEPGDAVLAPGAAAEVGFTVDSTAEIIPGDCRVNDHECAGTDPGPAVPFAPGSAPGREDSPTPDHASPPSPHKGRASPWRW